MSSGETDRHSRVKRWLYWIFTARRRPLVILLLMIGSFAIEDARAGGGRFASVRNLRIVLNQTSIVAVASLGMTLVIIAGGIDLSAGTALTLCATVLAYCLKHDVNPTVAIGITILVGCACGLTNGVLVSRLSVVPFIVTLGTMTIYLGIGKIVSAETTIFPSRNQIPGWLQTLCSTRPPDTIAGVIPNIPAGVLLALALAFIVSLVLRYTVYGRHLFALGSNESTARLCGINIPFIKTITYVVAGLFFAIAGVYHFATLKIGNPMEGVGLELQVIAAVVIGGGSLSGGRGSVLGSLTGAAIVAVLRSGCDQLKVSNPAQEILIGMFIISAVALDRWRQKQSA